MIRPARALPTGTYRVAADRSTVKIQTNHLFGLTNVTGTFAVRSGIIVVATPFPASTVTVIVDAASFTTRNPRRDAMVRSDRFLDAAHHPDITFTTDGVRRYGNQWILHGELTIRARSRPIELTIERIERADGGLHARATGLVDRYAFGLTRSRGITARFLNVVLDVTASRG